MLTTASRFAVLRMDGDDELKAARRAAQTNKNDQQNSQMKAQKAAQEKQKAASAKKAARKQQLKKEKAELQSLAFGTAKPKKSNGSKAATAQPINPKERLEWEKRDEEFVKDTYQQELEEALLASKIEYEVNKELYETRKKQEDETGKNARNGTKKSKKGTTMTLDQFNQDVKQNKDEIAEAAPQSHVESENFFDDVAQEAKKTVKKEQNKVGYKAPKEEPKLSKEPRVAQLQEELKQKDEELEKLREENGKLREELSNVKTRNKKLCHILVQGEMKEKSQILVEVDKLTRVKDELTAEVDKLNAELQQERSKVSALSSEVKKTVVHKK